MESAAASSSDAGRLCEGEMRMLLLAAAHTQLAAVQRVTLVSCRPSALTFA